MDVEVHFLVFGTTGEKEISWWPASIAVPTSYPSPGPEEGMYRRKTTQHGALSHCFNFIIMILSCTFQVILKDNMLLCLSNRKRGRRWREQLGTPAAHAQLLFPRRPLTRRSGPRFSRAPISLTADNFRFPGPSPSRVPHRASVYCTKISQSLGWGRGEIPG